MTSGRVALVLAVAAAGCAPVPPPGPAPPDALAYWVPAPNPSTYLFADTATFTVHSGAMGDLTVHAAHAGLAELTFRPDGERLLVEIRIPRLSGSLVAPPDAGAEVDEGDVEGSFLLAVDLRGRVEFLEAPALSPALLEITGPESLVRPLFVQLPGEVVEPGAVWADTVVSVVEEGETRVRSETVITTTLQGDTVINGRRLLALATVAENVLETSGRSAGVPVTQRLAGTTTGTVLWDPRRRLLVERHEEGRLTGTLHLADAAGPLPVTATVSRRVAGEGRRQ